MPNRRGSRIPIERAARFRLGSIEFKLAGISRFDLRDPYHLAVGLTWPQFVAALFALYLSLNVVFATLFWLAPGSVTNARPGSFLDLFFFSIETLATVGYGEMYPATLYGHVVVATYNGKPTLMVRVGNGRANALTDGAARLSIFLCETTAEGKPLRRAHELQLERAHIPVFPVFWTLMHVLDERSPLHGYDTARTIEAHSSECRAPLSLAWGRALRASRTLAHPPRSSAPYHSHAAGCARRAHA